MPPKSTADLRHTASTRTNLPSAEDATSMSPDDRQAEAYYYERNRDLDPQLVWRGKDAENDAPLEVMAPPIYVQERIRPKHIIDDLRRHSDANPTDDDSQTHMFADFNGLPSPEARTEFYQHQANWSNRMILGDSLQVMASLAEKEGLKGQVQCIYMDPPYGINFSSNWQWSTNDKSVQDRSSHVTREPEQIKAFRDTWRGGIHTYLSYLRDRLTLARDLLTDSGSIFVQIGDENVHLIRSLMEEVFSTENFITEIVFKVTSGARRTIGPRRIQNYILWFAKNRSQCKFRRSYSDKNLEGLDLSIYRYIEENGSVRLLTPDEKAAPKRISPSAKVFRTSDIHSMGPGNNSPRLFQGRSFTPPNNRHWRHSEATFNVVAKCNRIMIEGSRICSKLYLDDFLAEESTNVWDDTGPELRKSYVVQTSPVPVQRCVLMTTDPGDLVLDPTCGAGTTAHVAEQWGRRWITIDTSRVSLALARGRLMGARYPYYLLEDSEEGQTKRAAIEGSAPPPVYLF